LIEPYCEVMSINNMKIINTLKYNDNKIELNTGLKYSIASEI